MRYRKFGRTPWDISEITFGAWQLGGTWGQVSEKDAISTLLYAFDNGINMVDTAAAYGGGRSEELVGKAIASRRSEKIYVATKILPIGVNHGIQNIDSIKGQYPAWYVQDQVDAALRRLKTERIDLLQLHLWIEDGVECFEWLEGLASLMISGKVGAIGVSLADIKPETGVGLAKTGLVSSIQTIYNIFEQAPAETLFPAGSDTNTAFIARVPFDSGSLTGGWSKDTYKSWAKTDKRHSMYRNGRFEETLKRVEAVKAECAAYYTNLAEAALRFCLSNPSVSTVACGMRNCEEVDMNVKYADGDVFPTELVHALKKHAWAHSFYD
ncbi:MAG: aldo/keto reductase [Rhizobiales bacterium]|nr:aldo/keto reductase [Hyphomicrobiales bacterium]NRB14324.1 aldo/keto reductase [Hyphomicrobiales bacterium]